jgi:hypothetical protein
VLKLHNVLVMKRLVYLDFANKLSYDINYFLLSATTIKRCLRDNLGCQNLLVLKVCDFVTFGKTSSTQNLSTTVFLYDRIAVDLYNLFLDDGRLVSGLFFVPALHCGLLGLTVPLFHIAF